MRTLGFALLLLAGCGGSGVVGDDEGVTTNQIERLSTPGEPVVDRQASARLQPIGLDDLDRAGLPDPACDFSRNGRMLLAAASNDAVAKIGGTIIHLTHSGPVGPSGGFFEDRQLSISVGRTEAAAGEAVGATAGWPARIAVTNRRTRAQTEMQGIWRCGA